MLMTGITLVFVAAILMGWAGMTSDRIKERGFDISWNLIPMNSLKFIFLNNLESIIIVVTILSIILNIIGSILIGKESNLWIGIISFVISLLINEFLWQPVLSKFDILDFWDDNA